MIYIEIDSVRYPASVAGRLRDESWDGRKTKSVTVEMDYAAALSLFCEGLKWSIVCVNDDGTEDVFDNSEYSVAGPITDHRNGTVTVKMGAVTAEEALAALLAKYGEG